MLRQQIKWLLVGAAVSVALQALPVQAFDSEILRDAARILVVLAVPLPMLAAAIAIFKHGLWEIDVGRSQPPRRPRRSPRPLRAGASYLHA